MKLATRYQGVLETFERLMPDVTTELHYRDSYELLVAVILSAQCTDKRVNLVTPKLFEAFPSIFEMAKASFDDILPYISSVSYPNSKAKHLEAMAKKIVQDFDGIIPSSREELMTLPGVGRKTANVMLIVYFNEPAMPVDTHVFRVSHRIGLVKKAKTPEATEIELIKHIPREKLSLAHHWFILHGRYICKSRNPQCRKCSISSYCEYYFKQKE